MYPVPVAKLEREHPIKRITINEEGDTIMVVELLSEVDADSFNDPSDLVETLEPVFEATLICSNEFSANPTCYPVGKSVASCQAGPRNGASTGFYR